MSVAFRFNQPYTIVGTTHTIEFKKGAVVYALMNRREVGSYEDSDDPTSWNGKKWVIKDVVSVPASSTNEATVIEGGSLYGVVEERLRRLGEMKNPSASLYRYTAHRPPVVGNKKRIVVRKNK